MSQSEQFFQAVLDHPEDNALRLVYADWLEECGDPRGELIRVQIEMDQTPHSDLYWRTLKNRETELLDEFLSEWLGPSARRVWKGFARSQFQPFFADRGSCRLHRGFRETARIRARTFFRHADEIFQALPLRELHIFLEGQPDIVRQELQQLADCPRLDKIRHLILEYPFYFRQHDRKSHQALQELLDTPELEELRTLEFHYVFDSLDLAKALIHSSHVAKIEKLALHWTFTSTDRENFPLNHRQSVHGIAVAKNLWGLEELLITDHHLTDSMAQPIFHAPWLEQLTLLDLTGSPLGEESFRRLAASPVCGQLRTLRLSRRPHQQDSNLDAAGPCRALARADFSRLSELALRNQNIGPNRLGLLLRSTTLGNLRSLDLSGNPLGDAGAARLAECDLLSGLEVLKLDGCGITDAGLLAIARSPYFAQIEQLFLGGNALTAAGLEMFLDLPIVEHLRTLSFADCEDWGDPCFTRIAKAKGLKNLTELDITGQRMRRIRVKKLIGSETLSDLAHLSWYQAPTAKRKHDLEDLLCERWPGRVRI